MSGSGRRVVVKRTHVFDEEACMCAIEALLGHSNATRATMRVRGGDVGRPKRTMRHESTSSERSPLSRAAERSSE